MVVNIKNPGNSDSDFLIFEEQEIRLSFQKTGVLPDPRIHIPLVRDMDVFEDDIFICAYMKCGKNIKTCFVMIITSMAS